MLQVHGLHKAYGAATVLSNLGLLINDGEHVGLIGPNGAGKSTLLRIIIGREQPDAGTVALAPGAILGYLAQSFDATLGASVGAAILAAQGDYAAAEAELSAASQGLAVATELDTAMARYDAALAHFEACGG